MKWCKVKRKNKGIQNCLIYVYFTFYLTFTDFDFFTHAPTINSKRVTTI